MRSPSTPIYLDYNATCPLLPAARAAMLDATDRLWANPSSPLSAGREAARAVDQARRQVAALTDRDPRDVIFTSGATEANALALTGLRTEARPMVWTSAVEHPSALAWADTTLPVDAAGVLDLDALSDALARSGHRVAVVSVMAANNETGVLQPVAEIAAMVRAAGAVFHCDATQIPGRLPVRLDADLITLSAHKLGGPRGVGRARPRSRRHARLRRKLGRGRRGVRARRASSVLARRPAMSPRFLPLILGHATRWRRQRSAWAPRSSGWARPGFPTRSPRASALRESWSSRRSIWRASPSPPDPPALPARLSPATCCARWARRACPCGSPSDQIRVWKWL